MNAKCVQVGSLMLFEYFKYWLLCDDAASFFGHQCMADSLISRIREILFKGMLEKDE